MGVSTQLAQIALCSSDLPRSVQLYTEAFGFAEAGGRVLWGPRVARIQGLGDEMSYIAMRSLAAYPALQAEAALKATLAQLGDVATGEGTINSIMHTYGIIERYIPAQKKPMWAARQQHGDINFAAVNLVHVPVALASMLAVLVMFALALWRRKSSLSFTRIWLARRCSATP